ncbi:MAG: terminase large subunit [Rhodoblastus sp.]
MSYHFACPDWQARLASGRSLVPDLPLDRALADQAERLFDRLRLPDVAGQPTFGDAAGDWFRDIVRAIFGSLDPDGVRQVPGVFTLVPKKNSKTTNAAGLMTTALLLNQRPNAQFGLFGPTQEIADLAYAAVKGIVEAKADDPFQQQLRETLYIQDHVKTIVHRVSGAKLKVQTFDPSVATGGKFAGWLLDELHILGNKPYTSRVLGQLRGARAAIPESFGVIITTQSDTPPSGAFATELDYARKVRDGEIEDATVLPVLYEFPKEFQTDKKEPWRDPATWQRVNPNYGRSVNLAVLDSLYREAAGKGEKELREWASQHLNIQIGLALANDQWAGARFWRKAAANVTFEDLLARCDVITFGVDGGGLDDLFGLAAIGREKVTKRWLAWAHAWVHRSVLSLRQEIAGDLERFAAAGDLTIADDLGVDIDGVVAYVRRAKEANLLPEREAIGMDPYGIGEIVDALGEIGVGEQIATVTQGYKLQGAIKTVERKTADGTFAHGGQAMLDWCVGNAKVERKGNSLLITKQISGVAKIDPLMAIFDAASLMALNPSISSGPSIFDIGDLWGE